MSRYQGEEVLVVPRSVMNAIGTFQGVSTNAENYLNAFMQPGVSSFIDRELAENSPEFKQLIPYAIMEFNGKYLCYTRGGSGGEARLHDRMSLGIGGHINPIDGSQNAGLDTYLAGVERELSEEIDIQTSYTQKVVALINDDSNPVGSVHLGVVHRFNLSSDQVFSKEDAIAQLQFLSLEELHTIYFDRLETWSQLAVKALCSGEIPA